MQRLAAAFSTFSPRVFKKPKEMPAMLTGKFYLHHYALLPILVLCVADMAWITFCSFTTLVRADIRRTKWTRRHGQQTELLLNPVNRKLIKSQTYSPNPELYKAYEEMECAQQKRVEECKSK